MAAAEHWARLAVQKGMTAHKTVHHGGASRSVAQRLGIILAVIFQIGATFLPSLGIGEPIGDRSDADRTLITPAGWAFSIWGPLFAGTVLFAIYQALPSQTDNDLLRRIGWPAAGAFAGNGLWAIYTQLNALTADSVLIITATLICSLAVYRIFVRLEREFSVAERWLAMLPLSALAAWLTAATIVNISASLQHYGIGQGWNKPLVAAGVVSIGGVIAALAVWRGRGNPVYALVFLWALAATHAAGGQEAPAVAYAAIAAGLLVVTATIVKLREPENRRRWLG